ncbi:FecCD family ABC transporter permease [Lacibacterium aquatile]|uniref:FecCD family ABC transporter permease n=1 Tax=Lacibacterium aquatile TaxID=1168082 RepID=A0ABW5DS88_9PROT
MTAAVSDGAVRRRKGGLAILILLALLVAGALASVTVGRYELTILQVARILWDNLVPVANPDWTAAEESVVELIRLPRILAAMMVGGGLAVAGAALQGLFRNPLVDPNIIGVTTGAGFGGTLAILAGLSGYWLLVMAFAFGLGSVVIVKWLASTKGRTSILALVLAGVIVSAFFAAAISIAKLLADPFQKLPAITYWLMGSLASTSFADVALMAVAIVPATAVVYGLRHQINVLSLGEEKARALGVPVALLQWTILGATAVISAGVVANCGVIGWVGLVIPHIARAISGPDHGRLLPVAIILGAIYMLLVDTLARTLTTAEIPVGIITSLIGVPVFAILMRRLQAKGGWRND